MLAAFSFDARGGAMSTPRILLSAFGACAVFLLTASITASGSGTTLLAQEAARIGNAITGERLPNPAPKVTRNWGQLPAGTEMGHVGRYRCRPDRRTHLGLRTLRRGRGRRGRRWRCQLRDERGGPDLQVQSQHWRGAGELRQGCDGDAAWHPRRPTGQRVDCGLRGQ